MCRVEFQIIYEEPDTDVILDWEAQYKIQGTLSWVPFEFDWNNPQTPNIEEIGVYGLRVRLFDGRSWSDWFYSQFQVGCGAFTTGFSLGFES